MPNKKSHLRFIEDTAINLLKRFNLSKKPPVNILKIAQKLGLEVYHNELNDDVSGVLYIENGKGKIGYNSNHAEVRTRFTIAHELGHYVLNHKRKDQFFVDQHNKHMTMKFHRDSNSSTGEIMQEREANAFAAAILMPENLLKKELENYSFDLTNPNGNNSEGDDLDNLASRFKVSSQAMAFRLANLNFFDPFV